MTTNAQQSNIPPGFWIGLLLFIIAILLFPVKCHADSKYDTIAINTSHIKKFVKIQDKRTKIYAVYTDAIQNINELIPVSESVYNYVKLCEVNKITPNIGIKLKDGYIVSLIKIKHKYKYVKSQ